MSSEPRYTLRLRPAPLLQAQAVADEVDANPFIDATAIAVIEANETRNLWQTLFYFETRTAAEQALAQLGSPVAVIEKLPDTDWVRETLTGLGPVTAGRFFVHGSHDRVRRRSGGISIEIDAQTAFGTGHHGTTIGCLLAFDRLLKQRQARRILDLGCGTGVLAIAAARAGARYSVATDIDAEAVDVARTNAAINGVRPTIRSVAANGTRHPLLLRRKSFDVVFANILAGPLVRLAPGIVGLLADGGTLILSGLTLQQVNWVKAPYTTLGLSLNRTSSIGSWATIELNKQKTRRNVRRDSC
jgi:ribosomal protein L11 methyltransferase